MLVAIESYGPKLKFCFFLLFFFIFSPDIPPLCTHHHNAGRRIIRPLSCGDNWQRSAVCKSVAFRLIASLHVVIAVTRGKRYCVYV